MAAAELPLPLPLPPRDRHGLIPTTYVIQLQESLRLASWLGQDATRAVLSAPVLLDLLQGAQRLLATEPTLLELTPSKQALRVTVVGDTHGQYHDVCHIFDRFGVPNSDRLYIFNGDYVDRGAWGVETLVLLAAWKAALPHNVVLLRGNHEARFCTTYYGFQAELAAKYPASANMLYQVVLRLFAALPLAALVEGKALVLHGGLFRTPPPPQRGKPRAKTLQDIDVSHLRLGTLADLRNAKKGGLDPDPDQALAQLLPSDVTWSDPSPQPGHRPNQQRGIGTLFGPDVTQAFMSANGLRLVVRSHEGPDARAKRSAEEEMPSIDAGYAEDHIVQAGRLVTLFSAPDYPQFMAPGEERHRNRGAVLHLSAPDYSTPAVEEFDAVLPRPQATPYYDMAPLADAGLSSSSESTCGSASTDDENAQSFGHVFFAEPSPKRSRSGEEGGGPQLM